MLIPLITLRGVISNLAIENPDHNDTIAKIDVLRGKFGDLAVVDFDEFLSVIFGKKLLDKPTELLIVGIDE